MIINLQEQRANFKKFTQEFIKEAKQRFPYVKINTKSNTITTFQQATTSPEILQPMVRNIQQKSKLSQPQATMSLQQKPFFFKISNQASKFPLSPTVKREHEEMMNYLMKGSPEWDENGFIHKGAGLTRNFNENDAYYYESEYNENEEKSFNIKNEKFFNYESEEFFNNENEFSDFENKHDFDIKKRETKFLTNIKVQNMNFNKAAIANKKVLNEVLSKVNVAENQISSDNDPTTTNNNNALPFYLITDIL